MKNKYPIFIPSKGRHESRLTIKALDKLAIDYRVFIEPQEYASYALAVDDSSKLVILPFANRGLVPTRNYIWDYARDLGVKRYWTMDDNIKAFYRFNRNLKVPMACANFLYAIESFVDRYENVPMAGMNYFMFASRKAKYPPFYLNTRVYSNQLIETAIDYRFEGVYNDDTDLCLRLLKDGYCTLLFNAFLAEKSTTMTVKGGIDYRASDRLVASRELRAKHPDVSRLAFKWGRWHHHVDYSSFRSNKLKRRDDVAIVQGVDEFGMVLQVDEDEDEARAVALRVG
jgi:hypothetical protein